MTATVDIDFFIKQGDQLPSFQAELADELGSPVDLTAASVQFIVKVAESGEIVVDAPMQVIGLPSAGVVKYNWAVGDTDIPGLLLAEIQVTYPSIDAFPLTIPNDGYFVIQVTKELVVGPDSADLVRLRGMVGDRLPSNGDDTDTFWSNSQLQVLLSSAGGNLNIAALWCWQERAAEYSSLYPKEESGSKHNLSKLFDQAMKMISFYTNAVVEETTASVSGRIVAKVASMISCPSNGNEFVEGSPFFQGDNVRIYPLYRFRAVM